MAAESVGAWADKVVIKSPLNCVGGWCDCLCAGWKALVRRTLDDGSWWRITSGKFLMPADRGSNFQK